MKVILLSFLLLLVVAVVVSSDDSFEAFVRDLVESDESVSDEDDYEGRHGIEKRASKWVRFREKAKKALREAAEAAAKAKLAAILAGAVGKK